MKAYTGYYRTLLTEEEKKQFNKIASFKGSVTEIHDELLRQYIRDNKVLLDSAYGTKTK